MEVYTLHAFKWLLMVAGLLLLTSGGAGATTFNVVNRCSYTVWPASWSTNSGGGGSVLAPGGTWSENVPAGWSGRVWGRTGCNSGGTGCSTGDCGGLVCTGSGQPATLFETTLNGGAGNDYYDISIIDAFNLPMTVVPSNGACPQLTCADANCPQPPIYRVPDCSGCTQGCPSGGSFTVYLC